MFTIYLIYNDVNSKKYVGQTTKSISARFGRHATSRGKGEQMVIHKAIRKYGKNHFSIIELAHAATLEVWWGRFYNVLSPNGYNLKLGGRTHVHTSAETRAKIAKAHKGRKATPETLLKLSLSHKGYRVSEQTKAKLSAHFKGCEPHANSIAGAREKCKKRYIVISPDGKEIEICGAKEFCKMNGLRASNFSELCSGKIAAYKGWTLKANLGYNKTTSRRMSKIASNV